MKQATYFLLLMGLVLNLNAQNPPKQVPGTEGQKTHDEAAINSAPPQFQFVLHNGKFISNKDIPKNKPIILALFSPSCDHCQHAVIAMSKQPQLFKDITIIFVSSISSYSELENFVQVTGVANVPNIYVCAAQDKFIVNYFMPNWILPQIMVFNKQHKLKKIFYETIFTDSLVHYANK